MRVRAAGLRACLLRLLLVLAGTALVSAAGGFLATAPAAAEETPVPISEEQEAPALYAALTYAQLTSPTAAEEHINGSVGILETALLDIFDEITPVTESNAVELKELFAKVHIEPSHEENVGTLLEDFIAMGRQLGVRKAPAPEALGQRAATRGGAEGPDIVRPALTTLTGLEFQDAYQKLNERISQISRADFVPGEPLHTNSADGWRKLWSAHFASRYLEQAEKAERSDVDISIVDDAILPEAGTDASIQSLIQRAINSGYTATAAEAQLLLKEGVSIDELKAAREASIYNMRKIAPQVNNAFKNPPPPPMVPAVQAEFKGLATNVQDSAASVNLADTAGLDASLVPETEAELTIGSTIVTGEAVDVGIDAGLTAASFADPLLAATMLSQAPQIISELANLISGTPSGEQIVLEQLEAIKEMITNVSKQVHGELEHVDASLASLTFALEEDTLLLTNIGTHIGKIEGALAHLEERINELQADLLEIAKTQREEALVTDLDTDIGYSERSPGHTPLPLPQFEQAAGAFFAWGTFDPFDALSELPSSEWATEPQQIFEQLGSATSTDALDFNLDYLASFVNEHGWGDGLTLNPGLPNPSVWADGANALAQLLSENEEYETESLLAELASLNEVGESIAPELEKITQAGPNGPGHEGYVPQVVDGLPIETGSSILNHALVDYLEQGAGFLNRVEAQENSFLSQQHPGRENEINCSYCALGEAPNPEQVGSTGRPFVELWSGAEQAPSKALSPFVSSSGGNQLEEGARNPGAINACNTTAGEETINPSPYGAWLTPIDAQTQPGRLELDSNVEFAGGAHSDPLLYPPLPQVYANAWHLGLGHVVTCYAAEYLDPEKDNLNPPFIKPPYYTAQFEAQINWYWVDNATAAKYPVYSLTLVEPPRKGAGECEYTHPDLHFQELWTKASAESGKCREKPPLYYEQAAALSLSLLEENSEVTSWPGFYACTGSEELPGWSACARTFALESEDVATPNENKHAQPVTREVEAKLKDLRQETYEQIAPPEEPALSVAGEDLRKAANSWDGARSLLDDYIQLGLPVSLASDPTLGKLAFGPEHLLDDSPGSYEIFKFFNGEVQEDEREVGEDRTGALTNPAGHDGVLEIRMLSRAEYIAAKLKEDIAQNPPAAQIESGDEEIPATDARLEIGEDVLGEAPQITRQPVASSVIEGAAATFDAEASGKPVPEVHWEVSTNGGETFVPDTSNAGATADVLRIEDATAAQSGYEYRAKFTNGVGATTTVAASLAVKRYEAPAVTKPKEPMAVTVTEPETAALTAEATGSPEPSVQWEVSSNGGVSWSADITDPGNTADTLEIEDSTFLESGNEYRARFENQSGGSQVGIATSPPVTLTVIRREGPSITREPLAVTVVEPAGATFTAEASGVPKPSVQWEVSTNDGATFSADTTDGGSSTDTLKIEKTSASESGDEYRATFVNGAGSTATTPATLTVERPPTPAFTIADAQEIKGSATGYTEGELTGAAGQTVLYDITVLNTGNVGLTLANFTEAGCADIAGGPGLTALAPGSSTVYTCERALAKTSTFINEASVRGAPTVGGASPLTHTSNEVIAFGPDPAPVAETEGATEAEQRTVLLNATVNPKGGAVTGCKFEYGTTTSLTSNASCSQLPGSGTAPVAVAAALKGLAPNTTYHFRVSATNASGTSKGAEATFKTTAAAAPTVAAGSAPEVEQRSALLNATVNPNGAEVTACKVEYGTTSLNLHAACSGLPALGTSAVAVSAPLSGLTPNTTYRFRFSATSLSGSSQDTEMTFKTTAAFAPTLETESASEVLQRTALVNATVNPNGGEITSCKFEYGTSALNLHAPCSKLPGVGTRAVAVSAALTGLAPNTTYRFRISATGLSGTGQGTEMTLKTTPALAPTVATGSASEVQQRTALLHATVDPNGAEVTSCKFEYGTTTSYGSSASCSASPGSGTSAVAVSAALKGLASGATYHFRISATSLSGTSKDTPAEFKT